MEEEPQAPSTSAAGESKARLGSGKVKTALNLIAGWMLVVGCLISALALVIRQMGENWAAVGAASVLSAALLPFLLLAAGFILTCVIVLFARADLRAVGLRAAALALLGGLLP